MTFIATELALPDDEPYDDPDNAPETVFDKLEALLGESTVGELMVAKAKLELLMDKRIDKEKAAVQRSAREIAMATQVPIEKVLEILLPEKKRGTKVMPDQPKLERVKYRHPENPDLTWSGRGREPKWLAEARDEGFEENDLLV